MLSRNWVAGSLQLLFWAFFRPSAWQRHIAALDNRLSPDFTFLEWNREQWRNPGLRRLAAMTLVGWPLVACLVTAPLVFLSGEPPSHILFGTLYGLGMVLFAALLLGCGVSLLSGAIAVPVGIMLGVGAGYAVIEDLQVKISEGVISLTAGPDDAFSLSMMTANVFFVGAACGLAARLGTAGPEQRRLVRLFRTLGSVLGGIVLSVFFGLLVGRFQQAFVPELNYETILDLRSLVTFSVPVGIVWVLGAALRNRTWRRALLFGGFILLLTFSVEFLFVRLMFRLGAQGDQAMLVVRAAGVGVTLSAFNAIWNLGIFILPYAIARRIAGPWAGGISGVLFYILFMSHDTYVTQFYPSYLVMLWGCCGMFLGLTFSRWLPVVSYPFFSLWNMLLTRIGERKPERAAGLLRLNSAFWDDLQFLPMVGLPETLVQTARRHPALGEAAIEHLSAGRQRWAARAARIELDAGNLERCVEVEAVGRAHLALAAGELSGPASALLRSLSRISQDTEAAVRQEGAYHQRLALSVVEDRLDGLLRELTRSSEPYAGRFRPVAAAWRKVLGDHIQALAEDVERRQEIDSPYVIGVPLTEQQEIFTGRTDISTRIEQLLLDRRRPPILLYGQRRMGKTSMLNNLGRLLPGSVVPLFVDLQGPVSQASDPQGFFYNVARSMAESGRRKREQPLPPLAREALEKDPFTAFDEWLDSMESALGDSTTLLCLDEFEALEEAFVRGRLDEAGILGTLRHIIQHRPRIKILLAGSHTLEEMDRWAGYLINVQVVRIGRLKDAEALQLIERPVRDFTLGYESDACRRVLQITSGHPFLTQLLCSELVAIKNEQDPGVRRLARRADVEEAVPEALAHGRFFFADIERNQVDEEGMALLRFLARNGEGARVSLEELQQRFPDTWNQALALLERRELVVREDGSVGFQVELIRRWFDRPVS